MSTENQIIEKIKEFIIPSKTFKCSNESCGSNIVKKRDENSCQCTCGTTTCYLCKCTLTEETRDQHYQNHQYPNIMRCRLFTDNAEDSFLFRFQNLKKLRDHFIDEASHNISYMSNRDNTDVVSFKVDGVDVIQYLKQNSFCNVSRQVMKVNYLPYYHEISDVVEQNNLFSMGIRTNEGTVYTGYYKLDKRIGLPMFTDAASNKHFILSRFEENVTLKGEVLSCGILYVDKKLTRDTTETSWGIRYIRKRSDKNFHFYVLSVDEDSIASRNNLQSGDKIIRINGRFIDDFKEDAEINEYLRSCTELRIVYEHPLAPSTIDLKEYDDVNNWKNHINKSTILMKGTKNLSTMVGNDGLHNYKFNGHIKRLVPGVTSAYKFEGEFQHDSKQYKDEFILCIHDKCNVENLRRLGFHIFDNVHHTFRYVTANGSNEFGDYVAVGYICNNKYTLFRNYVPKLTNVKRPIEPAVDMCNDNNNNNNNEVDEQLPKRKR